MKVFFTVLNFLIMYSGTDRFHLKHSFGLSNEFVKSLSKNTYKGNVIDKEESLNIMQHETNFLASCTYEKHTQWGQQARTFILV